MEVAVQSGGKKNIKKRKSNEAMKDLIEIKGYKCPYCDRASVNKRRMLNHIVKCSKNDEYTQDCNTCCYLENDWLYRVVYRKLPPCYGGKTECPYLHCDDTKLKEIIKKHCEDMKRYGYEVEETKEV